MVFVLVLAGMRVRYGWRLVRPHQGSLSREAWFGAMAADARRRLLGKKGRTGRGGMSGHKLFNLLKRGHFLGRYIEKIVWVRSWAIFVL